MNHCYFLKLFKSNICLSLFDSSRIFFTKQQQKPIIVAAVIPKINVLFLKTFCFLQKISKNFSSILSSVFEHNQHFLLYSYL